MRTSIIIAAHNEGDLLWRTVRSCQETCAGLDYEIIVADDESTDGSIEEMCGRFPRVRVVKHGASDPDAVSVRVTSLFEQPGFALPERQGTSPTKDLGAREARGEVLVFLDGHCNPAPGAIARLTEDVERVGGRSAGRRGRCTRTWRTRCGRGRATRR